MGSLARVDAAAVIPNTVYEVCIGRTARGCACRAKARN